MRLCFSSIASSASFSSSILLGSVFRSHLVDCLGNEQLAPSLVIWRCTSVKKVVKRDLTDVTVVFTLARVVDMMKVMANEKIKMVFVQNKFVTAAFHAMLMIGSKSFVLQTRQR